MLRGIQNRNVMIKAIEKLSIADILCRIVDELDGQPRAFDHENSGQCVYNLMIGDKLCHCGVGFFLKPEYQTVDFEYNMDAAGTIGPACMYLDDYLRPEVQGYPIEFWIEVQLMHDQDCNWDQHEEGDGQSLNSEGQYQFDIILETYGTEADQQHRFNKSTKEECS